MTSSTQLTGVSNSSLEHQQHPHVLAHTFAQCIDTSLMEAMLSWLIPVGLGLLIGAVVGCLLALMIPVGRRPRTISSARGRR